jgi:hypothetical protein
MTNIVQNNNNNNNECLESVVDSLNAYFILIPNSRIFNDLFVQLGIKCMTKL